jgi:hypothetical protein
MFLRTKGGKNMPVETVNLTEEERRQIEAGEPVMFDYHKYRSHFADCQGVKQFRNRAKVTK